MSQQTYRANLNDNSFEFLSLSQGRTVILPKIDQATDNQTIILQDSQQKDKGIPQAYYMHDVMPTKNGFQSVGYTQQIAASAGFTDMSDVFTLKDQVDNNFIFSPARGKHYVYDKNVGTWQSRSPIAANDKLYTVAYLEGHSYMFIAGVGCYEYDQATTAWIVVTLTGLVAANIKGICSSNGFLLAWDDFTVYRGQAVATTNFTPDFALGSGAAIPEGTRAKIMECVSIPGGFIIYTTRNAVGATFQQNILYPFNYVEISGSAGVNAAKHVAWLDNLGEHYAWTIGGLQKVTLLKAEYIFPDLTDFLTSKVIENYEYSGTFYTLTSLANPVILRLAILGARYLVISYGATEYTHAFVYDMVLKRWGKLRHTHVAVFEFIPPNLVGATSVSDPKTTFGLLEKSGKVVTVNFVIDADNAAGLLILGKYQLDRDRMLQLDEVQVENAVGAGAYVMKVATSLKGKVVDYVQAPYVNYTDTFISSFMMDYVGINHSLMFSGTFNFSSLLLKFHDHGRM